jgi:hypothetical protein
MQRVQTAYVLARCVYYTFVISLSAPEGVFSVFSAKHAWENVQTMGRTGRRKLCLRLENYVDVLPLISDENNIFFSRSGVEINFSDVNIVTEVEHFLPREQIFANICSLGSFHFFDSCDKNLMGVFIFFDCCDKNLIVLSRQLLIPLNSSKDDNSFVIIFLFLKFEIFVLFLLPTVKKIVYILLERMLIFPSVLCSPRASPSGYKLHLRKNHAFLSLNI